MTDYLITGGAGFIGSNIAHHLVRQGRAVRILDNFSTGKRENLVPGAELIEGDLRDFPTVKRACTGSRYVLHLGAVPSVPRSVQDPQLTNDANITGTLNVLVAARDTGVKRVVFSSSSSVYGDTPVLPKHENMSPAPLSPYAAQKLTGELYCRLFWKLYGLETVSLRYFNVFGPRQNPQSQYAAVIPRFITAILGDESPTIYGDGRQSRDFSYVTNVIAANLAACEAPVAACGEAFNAACGGRITLLELVETLNQLLGKSVKPRFEPPRAGDVRDSQADISKAAQLLNWKPTVDFRAGIEETVAWYRRP
jgi:nucleoside-diphosphate-sugar epimerase